ncbi:Ubiquitin-conjugating enzyme E2 [Penicillium longicatenatum]|uniref:Ubiquitin-conjugating enzyme E2 n=1 Tax=Penicillium longicatenatum TaxID=1561947 RepID=UPI002548DBAD|nr:Ubiquitin-conjugating enzyme E2 [Penicillium longicatenatum]KAJ5630287.1 Ubiquitin-conjugating enzyme E2 [Penicillium longicatenatum]
MADQSLIRILREVRLFEKDDQLAMTIHYSEKNIRQITALLIGPPDTPYAFGFYQLAISIPLDLPDYPARPPIVTLRTTNQGKTRFGPNLYACGKICLTWPGPPNEEWSPAQGLESVLLSIQSLLSATPYTLEPGFENPRSPNDKQSSKDYSAKIAHENLRLTVIAPLELAMGISKDSSSSKQPKSKGGKEFDSTLGPFIDFCKQRFLWYREQYKKAIQDGIDNTEICAGQPFSQTLFESHDNGMVGQWNYPQLMSRFEALEKALMKETNEWPNAGLTLEKKESGLAVSLRAQLAQIVSEMSHRSSAIFDLALIDNNPFLWRITYFGRSGTPVDDGVFKIKIHISPNHPNDQPRVYMETPLFHVRVATDQMLIYLPVRADEMIRHIEGILFALEEKWPICNPLMVVNQESARLCWGNAGEKREYNRRLRRSVADSLENL